MLWTMPRLPTVTDRTFERRVLQSETPVVVLFTDPRSARSRAMVPLLEQVVLQRQDVRGARVDAVAEVEHAHRFQVSSLPTLLIFRGGKVFGRLDGSASKRGLHQEIDKALSRGRPLRRGLLERLLRR